jgi:hypothetical protein
MVVDGKDLREEFLVEIRKRLVGPGKSDEALRERPDKRYLCGMLFPRGALASAVLKDEEPDGKGEQQVEEGEGLESPTDLLFQRLPASVGLTFAIQDDENRVDVEVWGARYEAGDQKALAAEVGADEGQDDQGGSRRRGRVWVRVPLAEPDSPTRVSLDILSGKGRSLFDGRARLSCFVRKALNRRVVTITLINEAEATEKGKGVDTASILFQVGLRCAPSKGVPAYPDPPRVSPDPEAEELALQYRGRPAFAVGHGCGTSWPTPTDGVVPFVTTEFLPAVDVPPVTTEIDNLAPSAQECLSLVRLQSESFDPGPGCRALISDYRAWGERLEQTQLEPRFKEVRERVLARIKRVLSRLEEGVELLEREPEALRIFRLANRAMLLALARSKAVRPEASGGAFVDVRLEDLTPDTVRWRPFQLAFFLLSLPGLWSAGHPDRKIVDLIWFPTGGGKTEAYLGVAAFEMIRRRTREGPRGAGTAVLKRYTLRLLTIQQFERAGGLVCALETLRRQGQIPGSDEFSLGLWVGKDSAPNDLSDARKDLARIIETEGRVDGVRVPLKRCPVCSTLIVPEFKKQGPEGVGIRDTGPTVELFCPEPTCPYHAGLPISFIDEVLYQKPPTMLLGTIDKFAMLAWNDKARAFFGTDRATQPPSLVIQDELHLISGPLGTLAGVYEAAIDCAIRHLGPPAKIICATATIRRSDDQIRRLYGREGAVFPPPGLDASDSYFSKAMEERPGRLYVGAMGQGHTPTFSNVLTSAALLDAAFSMRERHGEIVDTWWTLVAYHNSKRELGKTLTLARDDIPARLGALGSGRVLPADRVQELSANLRDSQIPEVLHRLHYELPAPDTLDFVACTNMLSVGVDVQRLGLMLINGQPKAVSEYIQASSRIGRATGKPPGLALALLSPTRPRDRSHYEFFHPFHQAFYRHVEPTSVTPYALPARERAVHGAFLALVRMVSRIHADHHASAVLENEGEVEALLESMLARVRKAEPDEEDGTRERLLQFLQEWRSLAEEKGKNLRFSSQGKAHRRLIQPFRSRGEGWETLQSLRHVDTPLTLEPPLDMSGRSRSGEGDAR